MDIVTPSLALILIILLIAAVAYYIITRFIADPTLKAIALLVVGVLLLLKLLGAV